ncbi:AlbA family DNA-binding domain-containing protein [Burkholderia orbicola]
MFPSQEESTRLLQDLSESYAVEVKRWFAASEPDGQAKIIKALIALRNNGGGRLVVGFDNESMQPVDDGRPACTRTAFAQDDVQALVSRFASDPFEVLVQYVELAGAEFPVICVPSGIRTPVATKSELKEQNSPRPLVPINAVYVRTLSANNTVSTALAQWRDWARLVEICFDNREADVGRFVRRHLSEQNLSQLAAALIGLNPPVTPDVATVSKQWLDEGRIAFDRAVTRSKLALPTVGYFEIGAVIMGELIDGLAPNQNMLNLITVANRHLTGWPFFVTLHNADDPTRRPQVVDDAWETAVLVPAGDPWGHNGVDFWRIQPDGKLYAIRGFYEDFNGEPASQRLLAIVPAIRHVADGFAEALAIAKQLVQRPTDASLMITLRWTNLAKRSLSNAFSRRFWGYTGGPSIDDEAVSTVSLPVDLPDSALAEQVGRVLAPLFRKFQGFEVGQSVIDAEVKDVLNA